MSEFEKFIEDNFKELKSRVESGNFFAKTMRDSMHATWLKQQAEIDQLKAEKAGLERSVKQILSDSKESMVGYVEMDLYDKGYRVCTEYLIDELEKALRGTND